MQQQRDGVERSNAANQQGQRDPQQDPQRDPSQGGPPIPTNPEHRDEGRERRPSPGGQGGQREPGAAERREPAQEQDDFGGIGLPEQRGQRPHDPSPQR
jgi:hypothetical protein